MATIHIKHGNNFYWHDIIGEIPEDIMNLDDDKIYVINDAHKIGNLATILRSKSTIYVSGPLYVYDNDISTTTLTHLLPYAQSVTACGKRCDRCDQYGCVIRQSMWLCKTCTYALSEIETIKVKVKIKVKDNKAVFKTKLDNTIIKTYDLPIKEAYENWKRDISSDQRFNVFNISFVYEAHDDILKELDL